MSAVTTKLSESERTRYFECKNIIRENLLICFDVGDALMEIRDSRLYRDEFDSFEEFCAKNYGVNRSKAYRLMEAALVKSELPEESSRHVTNESQAVAIAKVPKEKRGAVLDKAASNGTVTAKSIKAAASTPIELDKTGFKIPEKILPMWQRRSEVQQMLTAVSRIRTALKTAQEQDDLLWRPVGRDQTYRNVISALDSLYLSVGLAMPYAVCPVCHGRLMDKCGTCQERGFVSEFFYKNCLDGDSKKVRESVCKKGTKE